MTSVLVEDSRCVNNVCSIWLVQLLLWFTTLGLYRMQLVYCVKQLEYGL